MDHQTPAPTYVPYFWRLNIAALDRFVAEHGHSRVPEGHVDAAGVKLGDFVTSKRRAYRHGRLDQTGIDALEARAGWIWSPSEVKFVAMLAALDRFVDVRGTALVPPSLVSDDGLRLGAFVTRQREIYARGALEQGRVTALEQRAGWSWDPAGEALDAALPALDWFIREFGHAEPPAHVITPSGFRLGYFVLGCRQDYEAGSLPAQHVAALEQRTGWSWS